MIRNREGIWNVTTIPCLPGYHAKIHLKPSTWQKGSFMNYSCRSGSASVVAFPLPQRSVGSLILPRESNLWVGKNLMHPYPLAGGGASFVFVIYYRFRSGSYGHYYFFPWKIPLSESPCKITWLSSAIMVDKNHNFNYNIFTKVQLRCANGSS